MQISQFFCSGERLRFTSPLVTPPKTNMSPENQWLEDAFPLQIVPFKRTFVSFQGCMVLDHGFNIQMFCKLFLHISRGIRVTGILFTYI